MFESKSVMEGMNMRGTLMKVLGTLALVLAAGCGKETAVPAPKAPAVAAPAPAPAAPAPVATPPAAPTAPAPVATAAPAAPAAPVAQPAAVAPPPASAPVLARSDGDKTGLSVEVTELKRSSGGTLTLKFVMINNTKEPIRFGADYGAGGGNADDHTVSGTHLIDAVNKKKYLVVRDSEKRCLCSVMRANIEVGGRANLWAKFPAPPEDVKLIAVMVPHFAPMDDVPVSP